MHFFKKFPDKVIGNKLWKNKNQFHHVINYYNIKLC